MAEKITKRLQVLGSFGVPTPESAEIGHYFKVKTIDRDGKVTETEAIDLDTDIQALKDNVADLMYEPVEITTFASDHSVAELGSTIDSTKLTWSLSKTPKKLTLDGKEIDVSSTSVTDETDYTANKTWALVATDDKGNIDSAYTSVIFTNASYYGVLEDGVTINSDTILGLTKVLQTSKNTTFTQTAGGTQCVVFAAPSRYETPSFSMNELDGGFYLDSTIAFTNSSGYTENYDIWMTESLGVGEVTVKVTYASEAGLQFNGGYVDESGYMHFTYGGVDIDGFVPFFVGGTGSGPGGGTAATYTVTLTNLSESRTITKPAGEKVVLRLKYTSVDTEGMDDGPGLGQVLVEGNARHTFSVPQGEFDIDVTEYLASGTNNVSIKVTNSEDNSRSVPYTITIAALSMTSSFDAATVYSGDILFPYTPVGMAEKTVYFELDGTVIGTATVTTSGRQQSYTIPKQTHGAHILRSWFTCVVGGVTVPSNILYYSFICTTEGDMMPIIAVTSPPLTGIAQYSNIVTKYRVYDPSSLTAAITLEVGDTVVSSLTVDRTEQSWTYQPTTVGELTQTIRCGDVHVSWTQTVIESSIQVEVESEALALYLTSYGRSNNEDNPGVWENNGVSAEFSNFNFVSDGWVTDDEDITVLRVTGNARLTIPYKIFAYDFRTTGKTLEFELATREVLDYSAEVLTCWSGGRGFKITAQELSMASEQSSLGTRYKEDEHIHICIVAEKKSENRLLEFYINGIMSGAVQYPEDDDFSQATPVGITIGSNDCTTDIYNIRAYDNSLTRYQTIENWIADTRDTDERNARFKRNDIYDVYGQVVISKLPTDLPYMVIQGVESPQFKGDKKTVTGYFTDPLHPELSYSFVATQIDVQGTSSQYWAFPFMRGK